MYVYPDDWNKSNVVPIFTKKKVKISLIIIGQSVSFLSSAKCLKKLFLTPFSITSWKISSFHWKNESFLTTCSITSWRISFFHYTRDKFFYCNPSVNVTGTFSNISKALAWWQDLTWWLDLKLKSHGVKNRPFSLFQNYLTNRQQRVLLNCQTSK